MCVFVCVCVCVGVCVYVCIPHSENRGSWVLVRKLGIAGPKRSTKGGA